MKRKKLGRSSLELPVISFGAFAIGGWYWGGTDDEQAIEAIRAGLDSGMNAIDTAPVYGFGHSEEIVGEAVRGRRDEVVLMTKVGLRWDGWGGTDFFSTMGPKGKKTMIKRNGKPKSVKKEVDRSLKRLGVEHIDLIQLHWPDPGTPLADTMGALHEVRAAGKVREIGLSNHSPAQLEEAQAALGDTPLASDQPKYSLLAREIEEDLLPWARKSQVGLIVYSPLDQGLLTGKVRADRVFPGDDGRNKRPTFKPENRALVNSLLDEFVAPIAAEREATIAQIVMAWTAAQEGVTSLLVGARNAQQARENALAGDIELNSTEFESIDKAFTGLQLS